VTPSCAKFTEKGSVTLALMRQGAGTVRSAASDTGIGIPVASVN
jgi:signal transduction histidine kinase